MTHGLDYSPNRHDIQATDWIIFIFRRICNIQEKLFIQ